MNIKKNFNALYKSYLKSAIFKSLIFATLVSCTVLAIVSFMFWYYDVKQIWIGLIVFAALELSVFTVMFLILKPTEKKFVKRLDSLGLQERVVTMYQYQNDESLMAKIQRNNAIEHINKLNKKLVKLATPVFIVVLFAIAVVSGLTTTTVAALASSDYIPSGSKTFGQIEEQFKNKTEYEVSFDVIGEGFIDGDIFQLVYEGEDCTPVMAIPEEGWVFVGWQYTNNKNILQSQKLLGWGSEDTEPYHIESNIKKNLIVYAEFVEIGDPGEPDPNAPNKKPFDPENQRPQKPSDNPPQSNNPSGSGEGSAGHHEANNQVFNGETFYGDKVYENAYNQAQDNMDQNGGMTDGQKDAANDYFTTIKK